MDFFQVQTKEARGGVIEIYPDFIVGSSKDLMVRAQSFYAVWNEKTGMWSTREYDVKDIVDEALLEHAEKLKEAGTPTTVKLLRSNNSKGWSQYKQYLKNASDEYQQLDMKLTFANTEVKKNDYVSRRLPYRLEAGDYSAFEKLTNHLYSSEELQKIKWSIGAIISGDSKKIEKFVVFFGKGGTGKSTMMKIIQKLFVGYTSSFEAKSIVSTNNAFAASAFKSNPLVAINHDGDLSKIDDNSVLNSIVSHDDLLINEKHKPQYEMRINAFLFMGTNKPVKITDSKSGMIRRVIDVHPTGETLEPDEYYALMERIEFELGAIAHHCLEVYKSLGKNFYSNYKPERMMLNTNAFYNFVADHFDVFSEQDGTTLTQSWELFKVWSEDSELGYKIQRYKFRDELKSYFEEFNDRVMVDGSSTRSVYTGFNMKPFRTSSPVPSSGSKPPMHSLVLEETTSILDEMYSGMKAQYSGSKNTPKKYWDDSERFIDGEFRKPEPHQVCDTVLGEIDTTRLHFLKVPEYHIVIDFDLTEDDGKTKSLERNLAKASSFPPTYAELSKSGRGVHLHYIYDGDVSELALEYDDGIEIKVYRGNASLRRKLTKCNNVAVATINSGLPFREKKMPAEGNKIRNEDGLRRMLERNLKKEWGSTKVSMEFMAHILNNAYYDGIPYDLTDMYQKLMAFANNSTNQSAACLKLLAKMRLKSEVHPDDVVEDKPEPVDDRVILFDCEVYPNLFAVCWKYEGAPDTSVVRMLEPTPTEVEKLLSMKLVGFNNRKYDNHILWARMMGASTEELYKLSQKLISNENNATFGRAWGASYADVYDFSVDKKGLKKWEIELNIPHIEMDIPWDQPVPPEKIQQVLDYCANDVNALDAVWEHLKDDFAIRQIIAEMSGLTANHSTRQHVMRILFGDDRNPQKKFVYTDLSEMFPGYEFNEYAKGSGKSVYRGEEVGEGGYVYAEPGMYENVALLDVASMHPTSIEELNLFGPYTANYTRLKEARLAIKHGDFEKANELVPGLQVNAENAKARSNAMKLVLNSTYGYTCAKFDNPARDPRNKDNIVAKRGALFMVDLKHAVQEQGFTVAHIKTDSIKIPNATPDIIQFVFEFGAKYGYTFEHEATYEKMCLVNDAVYVAKSEGYWTATGAQFKHPYVFKTLFTGEQLMFKDLCETKEVKNGAAMYLRYPEADKRIDSPKDEALTDELAECDAGYGEVHVGRSGSFLPVKPGEYEGIVGGQLMTVKGDKVGAVQGTKGYLWVESETIRMLKGDSIERMTFVRLEDEESGTGSLSDFVDMAYFAQLAEDAYQTINEFGDAEAFVK